MAQQAKPSFTVATRFFEPNADKLPAAVEKLRKWVDAAWAVGATDVLIAINVKKDAGTIAACEAAGVKAHFMPIENWGKFVPSLNAMLYETNRQGVPYILYASAEFPVQQVVVEKFFTTFASYPKSPVVGAVFGEHDVHSLPEDVDIDAGGNVIIAQATGSQTPWNTMAMWRVADLMKIGGFPSSGDWPADPKMAGVEECDALALLGEYMAIVQDGDQLALVDEHDNRIYDYIGGVLVEIPEFMGYQGWSTEGWDAERHALHAKKIASKNQRPAFRAELLDSNPYKVKLIRAPK